MQILFSLGLTKILIYRGGVIFWADMVGAKYIASKLNQWAKTYNTFFKPCAFLEERAASGVRLVSNPPVCPLMIPVLENMIKVITISRKDRRDCVI